METPRRCCLEIHARSLLDNANQHRPVLAVRRRSSFLQTRHSSGCYRKKLPLTNIVQFAPNLAPH